MSQHADHSAPQSAAPQDEVETPETASSLLDLFSRHSKAPAHQLLAAIDRIRSSQLGAIAFHQKYLPLHLALVNSRADLIEPLIQRGYNIDEPAEVAPRPLFTAVRVMDHQSDPACVIELLRLGAYWSWTAPNGETALSLALENRPTALRALLAHGISPDQRNSNSNTPLCAVALRSGINPDPAHAKQAAAMIELLLELGAAVDSKNNRGETALLCACESAAPLCVQALLHAGANPNLRASNGSSPLIAALEGPVGDKGDDKARVVSLLLMAGADANAKNKHGESAVSFAQAMILKRPYHPALNCVIAWEQARELNRSIKPAPALSRLRQGL